MEGRILELEIEEKLKEFYTRAVQIRSSNSLDNIYIDEPLLIKGPSGVGKSTVIRNWAEKKKNKINFVEFSCADIKPVNNCLFTANDIDRMSRENTIVFFDDYDLATEETKKHIDRLVTKRTVVDKSEQSAEIGLGYVMFVILAETVPARRK